MIYKELTVVKGASQAAQVIKNPLAMPEMQETLVRSLGWEIPWRRKRKHTPVFLSGIFHGERSPAGYSPWGHKESDTTKRLQFIMIYMYEWEM